METAKPQIGHASKDMVASLVTPHRWGQYLLGVHPIAGSYARADLASSGPPQDVAGFAGFPLAVSPVPARDSMNGASLIRIAHGYDLLAREVLVHSAECPDAPFFEKTSPSFPQKRSIYDQ